MKLFATRFGGIAAACLAFAGSAHAQSLDLSHYEVSFAKAIPSVPEAGAITYNWDRNSLMIIGDEGQADEYALDGKIYPGVSDYLGGSYFDDPEGITYIGGGRYVIAQERNTRIAAVGTAVLSESDGLTRYYFLPPDAAHTYTVSGGANWSNQGLEGISYDPITGGFFGVKENNPQGVFFISKDFDVANSPGTTTPLFDPALLGLNTISDIKTLSTVNAFKGTDFVENLLILSATSKMLLEVTRSGQIVSSFDLSAILGETGFTVSTIEGVTFDNDGNIYLAAELGSGPRGGDATLIALKRVVAPAVPEPASWAMMVGGFAIAGGAMRRRVRAVTFA